MTYLDALDHTNIDRTSSLRKAALLEASSSADTALRLGRVLLRLL